MPDLRPNVLYLDCHDIGDWLGCYGRRGIRTPNLDRLAMQSVVFDQHIAAAPICMPSRAAIYSGRMPHEAGVVGQQGLDDDAIHMAARFRDAGWRTVLAGRMMVLNPPAQAGFDLVLDDGREDIAAARFLETRGGEAPFFLSVSFPLTHRPFGTAFNPGDALSIEIPPWLPDLSEVRGDLATLAHQLHQLDRRASVILDALDTAGLADNTITVFTTEHGIATARAKHTLYDSGLRTALMIRRPGLAPRRISALTWNLDLMPTLLDLAGAAVPEGIRGKTMLPLIEGRGDGRDAVFSQHSWGRRTGAWYTTPMRSIRSAGHKLIVNFFRGPPYVDNAFLERFRDPHAIAAEHFARPVPALELYDLETDPHELSNLATDPAHADLRDDLRQRLDAFLHETRDPILTGAMPNKAGEPDVPQWVETPNGWRLAPDEPLPAGEEPLLMDQIAQTREDGPNHPRSLHDRAYRIWGDPDRFTKNPDMVQLGSGRLLLIYSDTDAHWSLKNQVLTIVASDDLGQTWFKLSEVFTADLAAGDERLVTPRLSLLSDGRLVAICDHDDYGHFHEEQPFGNWIWWSEDDGETWSPEPQLIEVRGFEPDRITEGRDGELYLTSHYMKGDSQEFCIALSGSQDGGRSWGEIVIIAHTGWHRFCEGALVHLADGGMACVMRENQGAGTPSYVAFSEDRGRSWSPPQMLPFSFHRPYAKQLADGRVLVTGRNTNGPLSTCAWAGDLRAAAGRYACAGGRVLNTPDFEDGALVIDNAVQDECRYRLMPPQNFFSEVLFEAEVRVEGPPGVAVASLNCGGLKPRKSVNMSLMLASDSVWFGGAKTADNTRRQVDLVGWRTVRIHHRRGLLSVTVDGREVTRDCVFRGENDLTDFYTLMPERRTDWGQIGAEGRSWWRRVRYEIRNRDIEDFAWAWDPAAGKLPDDETRRELLELHANTRGQKPAPDYGYSSWVVLEDGRIMFVDYSNRGDAPGKSHLVGLHIDPTELEPESASVPAAGMPERIS